MKTTDYVLGKFLNCDPDAAQSLNTIVLDVDEFFDAAHKKDLQGLWESVFYITLDYLRKFYQFARLTYQGKETQYQASVLQWDPELVKDAFAYLDTEKDLRYGLSSGKYFLELDNWDLYQSLCGTINDDYDSGYSFKELISGFCLEFYGGKKEPSKYDSILL